MLINVKRRWTWLDYGNWVVLCWGLWVSLVTAQDSSLGPRRAGISSATNSNPQGGGFNSGSNGAATGWRSSSPGASSNAGSNNNSPVPAFGSGTSGSNGPAAAIPSSNAGSALPWRGNVPALPNASTWQNVLGQVGWGNQSAPRQLGPELNVSKGNGSLPNDAGQIWREYDITPYTSKIKNNPRPEQAIVDWIRKETGDDVWFAQPLGILNADNRAVRVYHTPEVQNVVRDVVERFVRGEADGQMFGVRIITLNSPNWRSQAISILKPVDVQSSGVEAWLLSKENAAVMIGAMRRRSDYRELNSPNLQLTSGQSEVIARTRPRTFIRGIRPTNVYPGYEPVQAQLDEGFGLQISPLMSLDGRTCDAVVKCNIDQLEKLVPVNLDVPTGGTTQRVQIQVPQLVSWRLNERFRWPTDQVLLLSCGVVANPAGDVSGPLAAINPFDPPGSRSDALMLLEYRGRSTGDANWIGNPAAANSMGPNGIGPANIGLPPTGPPVSFNNPAFSNNSTATNPYSRGRY